MKKKKFYIAPTAKAIELNIEQLLITASPGADKDMQGNDGSETNPDDPWDGIMD